MRFCERDSASFSSFRSIDRCNEKQRNHWRGFQWATARSKEHEEKRGGTGVSDVARKSSEREKKRNATWKSCERRVSARQIRKVRRVIKGKSRRKLKETAGRATSPRQKSVRCSLERAPPQKQRCEYSHACQSWEQRGNLAADKVALA